MSSTTILDQIRAFSLSHTDSVIRRLLQLSFVLCYLSEGHTFEDFYKSLNEKNQKDLDTPPEPTLGLKILTNLKSLYVLNIEAWDEIQILLTKPNNSYDLCDCDHWGFIGHCHCELTFRTPKLKEVLQNIFKEFRPIRKTIPKKELCDGLLKVDFPFQDSVMPSLINLGDIISRMLRMKVSPKKKNDIMKLVRFIAQSHRQRGFNVGFSGSKVSKRVVGFWKNEKYVYGVRTDYNDQPNSSSDLSMLICPSLEHSFVRYEGTVIVFRK